MLGWRELIIVLVIVLLIFGTKKLANIGKDLGSAVGGFKKGLKDGNEETEKLTNEKDQDQAPKA